MTTRRAVRTGTVPCRARRTIVRPTGGGAGTPPGRADIVAETDVPNMSGRVMVQAVAASAATRLRLLPLPVAGPDTAAAYGCCRSRARAETSRFSMP